MKRMSGISVLLAPRATALRPWSRRDFLRAAGIGAASSAALFPFIPVASAQTVAATSIKRLLLVTQPDGTILNRWRSNGTGAAFVGGSKTPPLVGAVLSPLERHRAVITLVDGLDITSGELARPGTGQKKGAGHNGVSILWSGARQINAPASGIADPTYSNAATIDQILAASSNTRFRSIVVSTSPAAKQTYAPTMGMMSFSGPTKPVVPEDNPQVMFDLLFSSGVDGSVDTALKRRASRQSILSSGRGELSRLRNELPTVDRDRLDIHLAGIDDLDKRIGAATIQACPAPSRPGVTTGDDPVTRFRLHIDIVAHAFACDLSRIASVMMGCEASTPTWVPGDNVHTTSHLTYIADSETIRRAAVETMTQLQTGMAKEFSLALDTLDAGPGPSLLTDTLAVWGMGMGSGGPHVNFSVPFVVASKHPSFRAGYYHRYGNYDLNVDTSVPKNPYEAPTIVTPHNRMLTTLMHLMGRPDIKAVGDVGTNGEKGGADLDNTPLTGLM